MRLRTQARQALGHCRSWCRRSLVAVLLFALGTIPALALSLSPRQQQWLTSHPVIRYAPEQDYGPFVYIAEDGKPQGLSVDFLQLLGKKLDVEFQPIAAAPLSVNLQKARTQQVDLLTSLRPTQERAEFLGFTDAYVSIPASLVVRAQDASNLSMRALSGRAVAVGKGYAVEAFVREHYPQIQWQAVPSDLDGLRLLRAGSVDAVVADEASVQFIARQQGWQDLHIVGSIGFNYPLSLAYRKDWPELGQILNLALRSVSGDEREHILHRWMGSTKPLPERPDFPLPLLLAAILLLLALVSIILQQWRKRGRPNASV